MSKWLVVRHCFLVLYIFLLFSSTAAGLIRRPWYQELNQASIYFISAMASSSFGVKNIRPLDS